MRRSLAILGATGLLGQQLLTDLHEHPWFEPVYLFSSQHRGAYKKAVADRWHLSAPIPDAKLLPMEEIEQAYDADLIISALPSHLGSLELTLAKRVPLISCSSAHRQTKDIPLLIPEINSHHLSLIELQRAERGSRGFIVAKPNCSIQSFMLPLFPLHRRYRLTELYITTLQAMSGAGISGLGSPLIHDNIIPYIAGEEEKTESEPLKIFDSSISISAHCNRVPVLHGHMATISAQFERKPSLEEIQQLWQIEPLMLPSAAKRPLVYREERDRPQTRLDRDLEEGMSIHLGRLRECPNGHIRFTALSHNTRRGGATGALLIAEHLHDRGYLDETE